MWKNVNWKKISIICILKIKYIYTNLPLMLYRSISICGAVTANELNTSIRAKFCSEVSKKLSSLRQFTSGHCFLHSCTPQLTCNLSRSGNLKAGNVAENNFSIKSSSCGFDQPSSNGRYLTCNDGITC